MTKKLNTGLRGFKARLLYRLGRTSPALLARLAIAALWYFPWLFYSLVASWLRMRRWRNPKTCQSFIRRHALAFEGMDETRMVVNSKSGGVSNFSQVWVCQDESGSSKEFYVKIFLSAGSFWAKHLSLLSPFPEIYGERTHERFTVDVVSRAQLANLGIPVPRVVAYDPVEKVMVTELIKGETVDKLLQRIQEENRLDRGDEEVLRECGIVLGKIHQAGFSVIDTQPVNCIWDSVQRRVYFTDFEFCTREDKRVWDLGFFLCFLALGFAGSLKTKVTNVFLEGYQNERQVNLAGVAETREQLKEYLPILQTILDIRQFTVEELFEELLTGRGPN